VLALKPSEIAASEIAFYPASALVVRRENSCVVTRISFTLRAMSKQISVYAHNANPAIDPPLFHASRNDAQIRIDKGFALYLSPKVLQLKPPPGWTLDRTDSVRRRLEGALERLLAGMADDDVAGSGV
jgi:hypothetical protein